METTWPKLTYVPERVESQSPAIGTTTCILTFVTVRSVGPFAIRLIGTLIVVMLTLTNGMDDD